MPSNNVMTGVKTVTKKSAPKIVEEPKKSGTVLFSDIVIDKLTFTAMRRSMHQHKSYVNYDGLPQPCIIMTPEFELTSGGVLPVGDGTYNRNFILVPIDEHAEFEELLNDIDEAVVDNSEDIFGGGLSGVTHVPLVKSAPGKPKLFRPKLRVDFNSKNILTKVFVKGTPQETVTIDDVAKHITWGSTIQMVVLIEKIWADNSIFSDAAQVQEFGTIAADSEDARFGVSLVVLQVNVVKERELSRRSKTLDAFSKSNVFGLYYS